MLSCVSIGNGYSVHGIKRRASSLNTQRIEPLYEDMHKVDAPLKQHYGNLADTSNLARLLSEMQPGEVYNLGA